MIVLRNCYFLTSCSSLRAVESGYNSLDAFESQFLRYHYLYIHRRPKLTIREIDRINDLCKRMSDLCKRIEWDVTT